MTTAGHVSVLERMSIYSVCQTFGSVLPTLWLPFSRNQLVRSWLDWLEPKSCGGAESVTSANVFVYKSVAVVLCGLLWRTWIGHDTSYHRQEEDIVCANHDEKMNGTKRLWGNEIVQITRARRRKTFRMKKARTFFDSEERGKDSKEQT